MGSLIDLYWISQKINRAGETNPREIIRGGPLVLRMMPEAERKTNCPSRGKGKETIRGEKK